MKLFQTLRGYKREYFLRDMIAGIIIAAVSIPIAMGYAEVAGIPAVYGLYGSVLPILCFGLFTTSPQFIFGVDAAPAAIVGAAVASLGVESGTPLAVQYASLAALCAGLWLLLFYFLKAGKMVDYISTPVMGGFISGIAVTIILMQLPKFLGAGSGSGELPGLIRHIMRACTNVNLLSLALGASSLAVILVARRLVPKFPMVVVVMAGGALLTYCCHVEQYGVRLLSEVESGLPSIVLPNFQGVDFSQVAGRGLMVAVVIMAETLLSENNFAIQNGYKIRDNQEILACATGNIAAALVGCCPVNGSISRTSMNDQYGGRTQAVSIVAAGTMVVVLLVGTGFIGYLPVPVLAAIVVSALLKVVEWDLAVRLFRVSRKEFYIFMAAFLGVLLLGTIYGVIIGMVLSFVAVIRRVTNPTRNFLGVIPGREGFWKIKRNRQAYEIRGVKIYQFSESLFFANVKILQEDVEACLSDGTRAIILDLRYVTSIDVTVADRIELMAKDLEKRGIRFYLTEHRGELNDQLRQLGIGHLIEEGHVRRTITSALHDIGLTEPYPLMGVEQRDLEELDVSTAELENSMEEFAWAFGESAVTEIEKMVHTTMEQLRELPEWEEIGKEGLEHHLKNWSWLGAMDEDEILRRIELHMDELEGSLGKQQNRRVIWQLLEKRRRHIREQLRQEHPEFSGRLEAYEEKLEHRLEKQNPEAAMRLHEWEKKLEQDIN